MVNGMLGFEVGAGVDSPSLAEGSGDDRDRLSALAITNTVCTARSVQYRSEIWLTTWINSTRPYTWTCDGSRGTGWWTLAVKWRCGTKRRWEGERYAFGRWLR
jgi:hypothetical protein